MTTFPAIVTFRVTQYRGRRRVTTNPPLDPDLSERLADRAVCAVIHDHERYDFGTFSIEALFVGDQLITCESRYKENQ